MPVNKEELLNCVQKYVIAKDIENPFKESRPSRHWYEGFRRRHPKLAIRKAQNLGAKRLQATEEEVRKWFGVQENYLDKKGLLNISGDRIFNCDETNVPLCPSADHVFAEKGSNSVYNIVEGEKENVTVLFAYSASGECAPPMTMFPFKGPVPRKIVENTPEGWGIGISKNGWMTSDSFYEYMTNVYYPWLVEKKVQFPVVMWMDNHSSHFTPPLVKFCQEKQIEVMSLYPNATHLIQPLDVSFFKPFKAKWRNFVLSWKNTQNILRLKRKDVARILFST